jgi:ABC-2 type transport system permease protein
LLPIAALAVLLVVAALHLAGRRDLGASLLSDRSSAEAHTALLYGPGGLSARLMRPTVLAWTVAITATGLLLGFVAKQAGTAFTSTPSLAKIFARFGAHGSGAQTYLGIVFLMLAALVAFIAIGQVAMARAEEADGHLEHFLVQPVARLRWLGDRLLIGVVVLLGSGLVVGFSTWVGTASQHSGIGLARLIGAGLNLVPPSLCLLGLGVLGIGLWPRAAVVLTYGLFAWSLLVEIFGGAVNANHLLLDTSLFHQITAAPAVAPNLLSDGALVALGAAAAAIGAFAFHRRDLTGA